MRHDRLIVGAAAAAALLAGGLAQAQDQRFITIGTGGVTGVYYPTGGAICRLVNKDRKEHNIRCSVESTGGSVYNARTIREGELDFGIVQSDVQAQALEGRGDFESDGAFEGLRALFSVHPEPIHLMVRADSGVESVEDFKGKRINIGNPGSGTRTLADLILEYAGIDQGELSLAAELKSSEQAAALCDGKIDGAIWAAGLPNGSTMEATSTCDIDLVPLDGPWVDQVLNDFKAYARATVPGGMYPGVDEDVATWGPKATFITSTEVPDEMAYAVVKAVFDNFEDFKQLHPAFERLTKEEMVQDSLAAPLHEGAKKYYQENNLM